jgi:PPOX class probable F420-dependent enzyme
MTTTERPATELPAAVCRLLDQPNPAIVVTVGDSGSAQATVVWIERRGSDLAFFSRSDSVKAHNLRQRPEAVVLVLDPEQEFEPGARCYVTVTGTAAVGPLPDLSFPNRLARRYMGVDEFPHQGDYCEVVITAVRLGGAGPVTGTLSGWTASRG